MGANRFKEATMSRLIRMDHTGHSALAEWNAEDQESFAAASSVLRQQLEHGYLAIVPDGAGGAEQVRELPADAELVILRRPIAGG